MSHLFDRLSRPLSSTRGAVRPELPNRFEPALDQPVVSRPALSLETHEEREVSSRAATSMPRPARVEPRPRAAAPRVERSSEPMRSSPAPREAPAVADLHDTPRAGASVEHAAVRLQPSRMPSPAPTLGQTLDSETSRPQPDFSVLPQLVEAAPVALRPSPQSLVSERGERAFFERNQQVQEPAELPQGERRELGVMAPRLDTPRRRAHDSSTAFDGATRAPDIKLSGEPTSRAESAAAPKSTRAESAAAPKSTQAESAAAPKSTIRVHIGRVEVRAVPAAPTAPAPRTAKPSLPSLDDYLSPGRVR